MKYEGVTESLWYLSFNHWSDVLHSSIVNNITIASSDKANDILNHQAWTRHALHGKNFVANSSCRKIRNCVRRLRDKLLADLAVGTYASALTLQ